MDKNRPTDSEYIEMASHGLDISMDNDYDVIPADYGVQAQSTSRKIADDGSYLAPVPSNSPIGIETAQKNVDGGQRTVKHVGGSKWRTYFRLGLGAALVCLSVGVTLVIIYTGRCVSNVSGKAHPSRNNESMILQESTRSWWSSEKDSIYQKEMSSSSFQRSHAPTQAKRLHALTRLESVQHRVYAEVDYWQEDQSEPFNRNSGTFDTFSSTLDIRTRVTATLTTNAEQGSIVLRLSPANGNPSDFSYVILDGILYPFRVNKRGVVSVAGILKAKRYKFVVRVTDPWTDRFVDVTVVIICRNPSISITPSKSDNIGMNSVSEIYTHSIFNSFTTIHSHWQVSEKASITPTSSSSVLVSGFQTPPNRDASSKTMIHTQTGKDVIKTYSVIDLTLAPQASTDHILSPGILSSSFPDFSTAFSLVKYVSTEHVIVCSKCYHSSFSSTLNTPTELITYSSSNSLTPVLSSSFQI